MILDGDAVIVTAKDLEEFAQYSEIGGRLVLKRAEVERVSLPLLESLGGKLSVRKNGKLESFVAPLLARVGKGGTDDMVFENNPLLKTIELPALETVTHSVTVRNNDALESVSLPMLTQAPGNGLEIAENGSLREISLPRLRAASHFTVRDCTSLEDLSMADLEWTNSVTVENNPVLDNLRMPSLATVYHDPKENPAKVEVRIVGNSALKDLKGLDALKMIGRNKPLIVTGNGSLPTCAAVGIEKRISDNGWKGEATICGNAPDECEQKGCDPAGK